jgi:hypothetical protein
MNFWKILSSLGNVLIVLASINAAPRSDADDLEVLVRQQEDSITVYVRNKTKNLVIISDPEKSGMDIEMKSDKQRGGLGPAKGMTSSPWKHLILLTAREEDRPHLWSFEFKVKADRNAIGRIEKMNLTMWVASERDFLKDPLRSFKHVQVAARLLEEKNSLNGAGE